MEHLENALTPTEEAVGLTQEKKDDPFGIVHPPVPTSNADDVAAKYPKTLFHANLPRLDVHNVLEESNARAGGYSEVQVPKVRNTHPIVGYPKHFYKSGQPARIVYGLQAEAEAIRDGYGLDYIPQEFPKAVGRFTVASAEEEARANDALAAEAAKVEPDPGKSVG